MFYPPNKELESGFVRASSCLKPEIKVKLEIPEDQSPWPEEFYCGNIVDKLIENNNANKSNWNEYKLSGGSMTTSKEQIPAFGSKLSLDDELKLEYMDLDEFLTENDLPIETVLSEQQQQQQQAQHHDQSSPLDTMSPISPSQPNFAPPSHQNGTSPQALMSPLSLDMAPTSSTTHKYNLSRASSGYLMSPNKHGSTPTSSNMYPLQYGSTTQSPSPAPQSTYIADATSGEVYSPSTDEGQKMRKKKKQMVSEECKDDKYWERRRKNNMAAKRSRDARRAKESQIVAKATYLEQQYKALTKELTKARAENQMLRDRLCRYEVIEPQIN